MLWTIAKTTSCTAIKSSSLRLSGDGGASVATGELAVELALPPLTADAAVPGVAAVALVADDGGGGPFAMMALSRAGSRASWPDDQNK